MGDRERGRARNKKPSQNHHNKKMSSSETKSSADTKPENKEQEDGLQAPEQRFSCSPWRIPWSSRLSTCSP